MFLADYHTHSDFSSDGKDSIPGLLAAAGEAGLMELCVTDHCDISIGVSEVFPAKERYRAFEEARAENRTDVKPLLGIELGEAIFDLESAGAAVEACPYDFIIGSHHALRGEQDFYYLRYSSEEECHSLLTRYIDELCELAEWGRFDVLGHIHYPMRYMGRQGLSVSLLPRFEGALRGLFGLLARKGLGIEVNVSGNLPFADVLALYRRCGGEIVTIGSDAHSAAAVGKGITAGAEMCREAGFARIAAFEQRRVRFETI